MTFIFQYEPTEFGRLIPSVLIDSRATIPAIKNEIGDAIKAYTDIEVDKVKDKTNVLFFRIETIKKGGQSIDGVLAGYFSLGVKPVGQSATLFQFQLRPAFEQFSAQISNEINIFIVGRSYIQYYL